VAFNRFHGAYSEIGILQADIDASTPTQVKGEFFEAGIGHMPCTNGTFILNLVGEDLLVGTFECWDTKERIAYQSQRVTNEKPSVVQCAQLDVTGLFGLEGTFADYFYAFTFYDVCVLQDGSFRASYKYPSSTEYTGIGHDSGLTISRDSRPINISSINPNSVVYNRNLIASGISEEEGWIGIGMFFRLTNGLMGYMWWTVDSFELPINITGYYGDTVNHEYSLYGQIFSRPNDCFVNWQNETSLSQYFITDGENNNEGQSGDIYMSGLEYYLKLHRSSAKTSDGGNSASAAVRLVSSSSLCAWLLLFLFCFAVF